MFVDELTQCSHQAGHFPPHDRQSGRRITVRGNARQEVEVIVKPLTQLSEQDQVSHHRSPFA
ncbi:hypothetical protein [Lentzea sp. NPDC004782]|uniref:hypothetical protein n=1 Tax=Lentzea sp. NPDC004782 TaxID=3154458 RepID=UPI0033A3C8E1